MTTYSTEEAMALLKRTRHELIEMGRVIAKEQCLANGTTHTREVLAVMEDLGLLNGISLKDHWLGAVFRSPEFEDTGRTHNYSHLGISKKRGKRHNIHERTVKIWKLR